ncbi:hypothetical protein CVD25_10210 [Bacillus canaveralius]|uniref:Histidine phosphatase family protein n=1 Tax=Bacillus canaveralius TaxID=1403243 RepID=A0A2N5GMD2_9BACI|nr:phosphoglycerate mutase family protein [Bacillus canaveralius]PLR82991.1 hypothetical protein CU635_10990 [Bacillus canaveralius]PLR97005.1 hypothetical protein CVD25_10210 [Bacillus canaveralius]
MTVYVHFVRHEEVASHQGDVPITEAGLASAEEHGRQMAEWITESERVFFLHTITKRTRQTAEQLRKGVVRKLKDVNNRTVSIVDPFNENAIRNPDIFLGGLRVELVSSYEALSEQITCLGIEEGLLPTLPFWPPFMTSSDRIGYWLHLDNPPGENAEAVARRLMAYALSLSFIPHKETSRYFCVTHSPVLRAFLKKYLLKEDLGEPDYCESINLSFSKGICSIRYREYHTNITMDLEE